MAGILKWDLGDSSNNVNSNSFSHTYTIIGNKCVSVYAGTATGPGDITQIDFNADDLVGVLDISSLSNLGTLQVQNNRKLTNIKLGTSSTPLTSFLAYDSSLAGTLDVSGRTGLGGTFRVYGNRGLTKILNPVSSGVFSSYWVDTCNITGTLDVSGLSGLGGNFRAYSNRLLTKILNPTSSQAFTAYEAFDSSLNGVLDLRTLSALGGSLRLLNNRNLTSILHTSSSQTFSTYDINTCNITGVLDISSLTGLGGTFDIHNNRLLTNVINPASTQNFSFYYAYDCSIAGTLDVSGFSNLGGDFNVANNKGLTKIIFPTSSQTFTKLSTFNCNLIGTLDISGLTGLGGQIQLDTNPRLEKILCPSSNKDITIFHIHNCSLGGGLDLRPLKRLGGDFDAANSKITSITFPDTSAVFTNFLIGSNSISTLDVSNLNISGIFSAAQMSSLSNIIFKDSSLPLTSFYLNNCAGLYNVDLRPLKGLGGALYMSNAGSSGGRWLFPASSQLITTWQSTYTYMAPYTGNRVLDISSLTGLGGSFNASQTYGITNINLPNSSQNFTNFNINSCNSWSGVIDVSCLTNLGGVFDAGYCYASGLRFPSPVNRQFTSIILTQNSIPSSHLDNFFAGLHTLYDASAPIANLTIDVSGPSNGIPTGGWSNADVIGLQSAFTAAGKTLTIRFYSI